MYILAVGNAITTVIECNVASIFQYNIVTLLQVNMGVGLLNLLQKEGKQVGGLLFPKSIRWCSRKTPPSECGTVHSWTLWTGQGRSRNLQKPGFQKPCRDTSKRINKLTNNTCSSSQLHFQGNVSCS